MRKKRRVYTQKECLRLCQNLKFKERNPCSNILDDLDRNIFYNSDNSETIPTYYNESLNKCVESFLKDSNYLKACYATYCPLQCDTFFYDISTHSIEARGYGNITTKSLAYYAGFNTYENVSKSFYAVRVYYDDLRYTLIRQQPKIELFGLISSVGGTLGLFLGFSFISILELFETVAELVYIRFE
jgi:hypothetical protein